MAYKSFKEFIEVNYCSLLQNGIEGFVAKHYDGQGFHSFAFSLLDQRIENIQVMSLSCRNNVGPRIEIDVHVKADIVSKGLGTSNYEAQRKTRWFTIFLKAVLKNGLHDVEIIDVDEYCGKAYDPENALDAYLVPYISTDQLEDIADDFTMFYCGEEIYNGWDLPLKKILHELDLSWYEAELPPGEMGRMYFREIEEDYDEFIFEEGRKLPKRVTVHKLIKPGTILISRDYYFINGYGSRADTLAHEIVHWDKHDHFFEILALLNDGETGLYCDATPMGSPEGLEGVAKARWWAEWQANALAPRYLMPRWVFNRYFPKMIEDLRSDDYDIPESQIMEFAIGQIANMFKVSVYEAKLRALQLGYKQAEGTFLRVKGKEQPPFSFNPDALDDYQTFILDRKNGSRLYKQDSKFAELIDSKTFIYTGCVVCINHPLFVQKTDDPAYPQGYALTDFAREHVDLCCLKFTRHYSPEDKAYEYYDACYLSRDVNVADFKEVREIDYSVNQDTLSMREGLKGYEDESERLAKILEQLPGTFWGTFDAHMNRLKKERKITNEEMESRTGISERHIRDLRKKDVNVDRSTVYALCIGMHLHPYLSSDFVAKGCGGYPATKEGLFYRTLIERHYMEPLSYINKKLKERGYTPWGKEENIIDLNEDAEEI